MKTRFNLFVKVLLLVIMMLAIGTPLGGCASTERCMKDIESDVSGGLPRVVRVYSMDGKTVIAEYTGQIDLLESDNGLLFELDGHRYFIYMSPTIVEEV